MKAFITGGAGFIGSHLAKKLLKKGHKVIVYDNLSSGSKDLLLKDSNLTFIKADILDFKKLKLDMVGTDIVFHIAANPDIRKGTKETDIDLKNGTIGTYNVLEAMRLNKIKKIVFTSSSVVYGEAEKIPTPEDALLKPISLYGAGKLGAEAFIMAFCASFDFQAWIYRFANVVGTDLTHGVVYDFIQKLRANSKELEILGDGKQSKSYVWIDDAINGMLFGLEKAKERVNIFNLGTDGQTNVTRIAELVIREMGLKGVRFRYTGGKRGWVGDVPIMKLDASKLLKLGWKPNYSSDEAIRMAIRAALENKGRA